jgi:hypothetical protein
VYYFDEQLRLFQNTESADKGNSVSAAGYQISVFEVNALCVVNNFSMSSAISCRDGTRRHFLRNRALLARSREK